MQGEWLSTLIDHDPEEQENLITHLALHITPEMCRLLPHRHHESLKALLRQTDNPALLGWCSKPRATEVFLPRSVPFPGVQWLHVIEQLGRRSSAIVAVVAELMTPT